MMIEALNRNSSSSDVFHIQLILFIAARDRLDHPVRNYVGYYSDAL